MRIAGNAGGSEPTQFGGFSIATAGKARFLQVQVTKL
jgi:hypothetical protein